MRTVSIILVLALVLGPTAAGAQSPPSYTAGLAEGRYASGCALLERTIFRVDVLEEHLRFGPETAEAIRRLAEAGASRDSIAAAAMASRNAMVRTRFLRDIDTDRFIEGLRSDLRHVVDAGVIPPETFREISGNLPGWYSFLEGRGVREGDEIFYRIRGDTVRSGYRAGDGTWLLERTVVGPDRRLAVMGNHLVVGSGFREKLLDSFLAGGGC